MNAVKLSCLCAVLGLVILLASCSPAPEPTNGETSAVKASDTGVLELRDFGYNQGWRVDKHPRLIADVSGDGNADIVGFGTRGTHVSIYDVFNHKFAPVKVILPEFGYNQGWRVDKHLRMTGDVNGDGRADVIGFADRGVLVALSTGDEFAAPILGTSFFNARGWSLPDHPRMMADVNGDGKDDIVGFADKGTYVALSTGSSFGAARMAIDFFGTRQGWDRIKDIRTVADVNGDGKADIVAFRDDGLYYALSDGRNFSSPKVTLPEVGNAQGWSTEKTLRHVRDVNGDGKDDFVGFGREGVYTALSNGSEFGTLELSMKQFGYEDGWSKATDIRLISPPQPLSRSAGVTGFNAEGIYYSFSINSSAFFNLGGFGSSPAAGGWRVDRHPRFTALLTDSTYGLIPKVIGFGDDGVSTFGLGQFCLCGGLREDER